MSDNTNLMSTTAAMKDNLAEKFEIGVVEYCLQDCKNCPLYGVAGCPLFRAWLSTEVNGKDKQDFRIVCYIMRGVH